MVDINKEISLIKYLQDKRKLSYEGFTYWVGKRYNESNLFKTVMHESTCITDGMEMLLTGYRPYSLPEEFWLSKIAEDSKSNKISLRDSVAKAYDLLNKEGSGSHHLSSLLYKLVDDYSEETISDYIRRVKESKFEELLQKYNLGQWNELYEQVFGTET